MTMSYISPVVELTILSMHLFGLKFVDIFYVIAILSRLLKFPKVATVIRFRTGSGWTARWALLHSPTTRVLRRETQIIKIII